MKNPFNPLRGWHVMLMLVAFFGVTIGVNVTFITLALGSHPGEEIPRSYLQGLSYNDVLEQRQDQAENGWTARSNTVGDRFLLAISDADGAPVTGLALEGSLRHPTQTEQDCDLGFSETRPGVYEAQMVCLSQGIWRARIVNTGDVAFEAEAPVCVRDDLAPCQS